MPIWDLVDVFVNTVFLVVPYVGALTVVVVAGSFGMHLLKKRNVVTSDDLARFNSKFPLDYLARSLNDPEFDPQQFLGIVRTLFAEFHRGVELGSLEKMKRFMTPELYGARMASVDARKAKKQRAVMKKFKLHGATIRDAVAIGGYDAITVRLLASSADYEIDANGRMFGDKTIRAWEEDWVFERSIDKTTKLRDTWTLTAISAVDRNRFRPDQIRNQQDRNQRFRTGQSFRS